MTWTWAEPFAGAAACALRLVGGRDLSPPCAWMGGKRRYARAILDAMGVPEEPPARVLLADAGPWGWVWPLLLEPGAAARVAAVLRSWAGEHPRELWQRLAAVPPHEQPHERAAQWLWLQARSASGVPIWWDGWRSAEGTRWEAMCGRGVPQRPGPGAKDARPATDRGEDLRRPGHQAQRDAWLASDGRGQPRPAGARAVGGRWDQGSSRGRPPQPIGQRGRPEQLWRMGKTEGRASDQPAWQKGWCYDPKDLTPEEQRADGRPPFLAGWRMGEEIKKARRGDRTVSQTNGSSGPSRTGGMVNPGTIADRIEALAEAFRRVDVVVHHGDSRELGPFADVLDVACPKCARSRGEPCVAATGKRPHHARLLRARAAGPTLCYLDPPYCGATGYGWDLPRAEVLALARRWADAGAVVAVSEAEPLPLDGWHHLDLTREGGKPEWLTLSRAPARHPARQGVLFASPEGA